MLDYQKIGKLIVKERQKQNLTQEELGEKLYVTRQAVSKWERGKCMPDYDSLIRLSELFSISLNEIMKGERTCNPNKKNILKSILFIIFIIILLFLLILFVEF